MTPLPKKIIALLIIVSTFCCGNLYAQHVGFLFGHALYAGPVDKNFSNYYNTGIGAEAGGGIGWNKTYLVGTIGYTNFFHKSTTENETGPYASGSDLHFIPMKLGIRQYVFMKMIYLHGDLGLGTIKSKNASDTRFSGDIGAGVKLVHFEVQIDYDGFTRNNPSGYASWFGIKAGLEFGL